MARNAIQQLMKLLHCSVVNGDTCKIASSIAVDSMTIVCAPVRVGDQGTLGASSVLLPGVTVGSQATLAPLACPAAGTTIEPLTVNIGAPCMPVKVFDAAICRSVIFACDLA